MRTRIYLVSLWILLVNAFSWGQSADVQRWFQDGNHAYAQANYPAAVEAYSKIISTGFENEWVLFNLGNAYFKQNRVGLAIYCFEKALRISPATAEIRDNLEFARGRIVDKIETPAEDIFVHAVKRFFTLFSINQETGLATFFSLCGGLCLLCSIFRFFPSGRSLQLIAAAVLLLLSLIWGTSNAIRIYQITHEKSAIILVDKVDILSGPASGNPVLFSLHEGTRVEVRQEAGEWSLISLPNGWSGWVMKSRMGII
jgi:tetratricopeptide (TPR) repeat protein